MIRSLTMLNQSGDTTVTWEAANDDAMLAIIERKMAAGVSFFIAPMTKAGKPDKRKKAQRIDNPEQARAARAVSIPDSDLAKFVSDGLGDVIKAPFPYTDRLTRQSRPTLWYPPPASKTPTGCRGW